MKHNKPIRGHVSNRPIRALDTGAMHFPQYREAPPLYRDVRNSGNQLVTTRKLHGTHRPQLESVVAKTVIAQIIVTRNTVLIHNVALIIY